jgi:hypothetical protein
MYSKITGQSDLKEACHTKVICKAIPTTTTLNPAIMTTSNWKRPHHDNDHNSSNINFNKRRRTNKIFSQEDIDATERKIPIESSSYLSSSSSPSSLSYSSSFSSIVHGLNASKDCMGIISNRNDMNSSLQKVDETHGHPTKPKCWWSPKSTKILNSTIPGINHEASDTLKDVFSCCACQRSLSSTEDYESINSPLICAYCERYVCLSCSKPCWKCQELICSLCYRWEYHKFSERLFCGKCYDSRSCRSMESPSFHDTDEMDCDF